MENRDPSVNTASPSPPHLAPAPPAESREPGADRPAAIPPTGDDGTIPAVALAAYQRTAADQALNDPQCHLPWALLAAIGKVESNHADGGRFNPDGTTTNHIIGPEFDVDDAADPGSSTPGHPVRQRAIGPMQVLPTIWKRWAPSPTTGADPDPDNIFDAASATAAYLCSGGRDLSSPQQLSDGILLYNHSNTYLRSVLSWIRRYSETEHRIDVDHWLALSPADRSDPVRVSLRQ